MKALAVLVVALPLATTEAATFVLSDENLTGEASAETA